MIVLCSLCKQWQWSEISHVNTVNLLLEDHIGIVCLDQVGCSDKLDWMTDYNLRLVLTRWWKQNTLNLLNQDVHVGLGKVLALRLVQEDVTSIRLVLQGVSGY